MEDPREVVKQNTAEAFNFFWASDYAKNYYVSAGRALLFDHVYKIISNLKPISLLDVGCGPGDLLKRDNETPFTVGLDYSVVAARCTQYVSRARPVLADATAIPIKSDSFDCVACIETLEHVDFPGIIAKELERVSRKYVVVSVPDGSTDNWDGHKHFFDLGKLLSLFDGHLIHHEICQGVILIVLEVQHDNSN